MRSLYLFGLLFLFSMCKKEEKDNVRRITHTFIPPYEVGDTLRFSSDSGYSYYLIRENTRQVLQAPAVAGGYLREEVSIKLYKIGDTRQSGLNDFYSLWITKELIGFRWDGCSQDASFQYIGPQLKQVSMGGRTYNRVLEKSALCGDSLNPMRLTYDLDSGILGYVDSSSIRWTLVHR